MQHVPATSRTAFLSGCSSIWRAIHLPSKCAYHHPFFLNSGSRFWSDGRTNGMRKQRWSAAIFFGLDELTGFSAAERFVKIKLRHVNLHFYACILSFSFTLLYWQSYKRYKLIIFLLGSTSRKGFTQYKAETGVMIFQCL